LLTALQLFFRHGYKDVSYDMLMKKAGLSKGAIYHHFASKDDLLVAAFEFFFHNFEKHSRAFLDKEITDFRSLKKLLIQMKMSQLAELKNILGVKSLEANRILFFVEALSENRRLLRLMGKMVAEEMKFLYGCFARLKSGAGPLKGKNAALWTEVLFLKLQQAEIQLFFFGEEMTEKNFRKAYTKAFDDFEKLIR